MSETALLAIIVAPWWADCAGRAFCRMVATLHKIAPHGPPPVGVAKRCLIGPSHCFGTCKVANRNRRSTDWERKESGPSNGVSSAVM